MECLKIYWYHFFANHKITKLVDTINSRLN